MSLSQFPLQSAGITYGASTFWDQLQDEIPAGVEGLSDYKVQQRGAGAIGSRFRPEPKRPAAR